MGWPVSPGPGFLAWVRSPLTPADSRPQVRGGLAAGYRPLPSPRQPTGRSADGANSGAPSAGGSPWLAGSWTAKSSANPSVAATCVDRIALSPRRLFGPIFNGKPDDSAKLDRICGGEDKSSVGR